HSPSSSVAGDLRLSLLLSQLVGSQEVRELLALQLADWHQLQADAFIQDERLRIFCLLSGKPVSGVALAFSPGHWPRCGSCPRREPSTSVPNWTGSAPWGSTCGPQRVRSCIPGRRPLGRAWSADPRLDWGSALGREQPRPGDGPGLCLAQEGHWGELWPPCFSWCPPSCSHRSWPLFLPSALECLQGFMLISLHAIQSVREMDGWEGREGGRERERIETRDGEMIDGGANALLRQHRGRGERFYIDFVYKRLHRFPKRGAGLLARVEGGGGGFPATEEGLAGAGEGGWLDRNTPLSAKTPVPTGLRVPQASPEREGYACPPLPPYLEDSGFVAENDNAQRPLRDVCFHLLKLYSDRYLLLLPSPPPPWGLAWRPGTLEAPPLASPTPTQRPGAAAPRIPTSPDGFLHVKLGRRKQYVGLFFFPPSLSFGCLDFLPCCIQGKIVGSGFPWPPPQAEKKGLA
ncbi:Nuclear pore complex protein Nup98-Nup96, partial [Ophiophagus hannah]